MKHVQSNVGAPTDLIDEFTQLFRGPQVIEQLQSGLIGKKAEIDGPFGARPLIYADYVASGRALLQIEEFILELVLPYYANSHTEASFCGGFMTRLRAAARAYIASCCGATADHAVIFAGSGATAGLNRLVSLLGVSAAVDLGRKARVIIGPYEHHSNILPWRESGAEVVEIAEAESGGPDIDALSSVLHHSGHFDLTIAAFSAASNVTGVLTDVGLVTRMVKSAGGRIVWDYAGAGPYLPIEMCPAADAEIDAVVVSPHKFIGGPGASGVLIVRRDAVASRVPSWPGGGTVRFVSPKSHDYSEKIEAREEAGTPNVIGDIRAALAFAVKSAIGVDFMQQRNEELKRRALLAWCNVPGLELLGSVSAPRLPIFSFRLKGKGDEYIHQQLVTRLLSDLYGIQARGGCACAGPYAHRLLGIDDATSEQLRRDILSGNEIRKPGFTRLNLSVLLQDDEVDFILTAVAELAGCANAYVPQYAYDRSRAVFSPREAVADESLGGHVNRSVLTERR